MNGWLACAIGIMWREGLRFTQQRERFLSALVRPLVWLFIFAAGFRSVLGLSIIEPYETYVLYEVYIVPGLCAMIQLFNGMQSSLSMVYDRETGAMRTLLVSPFPRWYLLSCKLVASVVVSLFQVYAFLLIAYFWEVEPPLWGYLTVLPALILSGMLATILMTFNSWRLTAVSLLVCVCSLGLSLLSLARPASASSPLMRSKRCTWNFETFDYL